MGCLGEMRRDPLALLEECVRRYGDVVRVRLGPRTLHLVNHPDHVDWILHRNRGAYDKRTRSTAVTRAVCGESVLTSDGESWERRRRLLQPAFHHGVVRDHAARIFAAAGEMISGWETELELNAQRDIGLDMMRLTFTIAGRCLFRRDLRDQADGVEEALRTVLAVTWRRIESWAPFPGWMPGPGHFAFARAMRCLNGTVDRMIHDSRELADEDPEAQDILSLLIRARDSVSGAGLGDVEVRNEVVTLLLAGHETTANALCWAFHLLSRHPEHQEALGDEARAVLGDGWDAPDEGRVRQLEGIGRLLSETLRLYPPVWIMERRVARSDTVGGYTLARGSSVLVSPFALHRHPDYWDRPDRFDPDRFRRGVPPVYMPFGSGPRSCIGREFALLEAKIVLAAVLRAFVLHPVPGFRVEPLPGITLRLRNGLRLMLEPRAAGPRI